MTFAAYWDRLKAKTPDLSNENQRMTIRVENFRIAIAKAYAAGRDEARQETERTADELTGDQGIMDVFKGIFGGGR